MEKNKISYEEIQKCRTLNQWIKKKEEEEDGKKEDE